MPNDLHQLLDQLQFRGMAQVLDGELARAEREAAPVQEVLMRLLREEDRHRRERSLAYRIRQAKLPWGWTLDSFPFAQQLGINKSQIRSLAGLSFMERAENIIFIGQPGTGKTGLATGLLRKALLNDYRGRFYSAQDLLDELYSSLADHASPKLLQRLASYLDRSRILM